MNKYSIHLVVASDGDAETTDQLQRCVSAFEMVLNTNGMASELIMVTKVDQEWVDRIHDVLDEADEEE